MLRVEGNNSGELLQIVPVFEELLFSSGSEFQGFSGMLFLLILGLFMNFSYWPISMNHATFSQFQLAS